MKDEHPHTIQIEIDREGLRKYFRKTWLQQWLWGLSIFGILFGVIIPLESIENGKVDGPLHLIQLLLTGAFFGLLLSTSIALTAYFICSHSKARKIADSQTLTVEGAFLRITKQTALMKVDRKIHFRAVIDFSIIEDSRMEKYGIKALQMNTTGGSAQSLLRIDGIKECDKVRDMLAEIDHLRENQTT